MCSLLSPSCPSPSSLHLKGPAATVLLRPIFLSLELSPLLDSAISWDLLEPTLLLLLPLPLLHPLLPLEAETASSSSPPPCIPHHFLLLIFS